MLPKKHRLSKSADVKQTTARGRSFFNPFFVIKTIKGSTFARLTVIVSTKVSKKAVVRNRIKRVVRNTIQKGITDILPGSYAIIIKPKALVIPSAELVKEINTALKASKSLKL